MPYKDKEKARQKATERKRKQRTSHPTLVTPSTTQNVTPKRLLTRPNMLVDGKVVMVDNEYDADELLPDGTNRYMGPFSDGQVLDKVTLPPIDKTTAAYKVFTRCRVFTPNLEQLRENGVDLLMKPHGGKDDKK